VAIIFEGGQAAHWITRDLTTLRIAVVMDNIAKLNMLPELDEVILATNYPHLAAQAKALGVSVVEDLAQPFHFGRALQHIVHAAHADGVICMGGAAAPFMSVEEFRQLAHNLRTNKSVVYTNNPQSADIVAFTPANSVLSVTPPENDNSLATALRDQAGLTRILIPHSVGAHFDLDTPTDALVMALSPHTGPRARACLVGLGWDTSRMQQAISRMSQPHCELGLIGRVNPAVMTQINTHTYNRLRVFSEERGMKALAREEQGKVVSLLGFFLEQVGADNFFAYLARTCDVCFIDTRVLFAHFKLQLTDEDRFMSDLGLYNDISNPWLKDFTRAAVQCDIPIVLGGHSLVTGGMWAILDILKRERALGTVGRLVHKLPVSTDSPLVGLSLNALKRLGVHDAVVVAVDTPHGPLLDPPGNFILQPQVVMHVVGSDLCLRTLEKLSGAKGGN